MKKSRWVTDTSPTHVGNVKQSVHALEVNKGTEVGDVLNLTFDLVANLDALKEVLTHFCALTLDNFAARKNDVLTFVVNFNNFKFIDLANIFVEIFRWNDVDL